MKTFTKLTVPAGTYFIEKQRAKKAVEERGKAEVIKHSKRCWEYRWKNDKTSVFIDPEATCLVTILP